MSVRLLSRLARLEHMSEANGRTVYVWLRDGDTVEARMAALIGSGEAEANDHFQPVRWLRSGENDRASQPVPI